jgi:hypothetical protein
MTLYKIHRVFTWCLYYRKAYNAKIETKERKSGRSKIIGNTAKGK